MVNRMSGLLRLVAVVALTMSLMAAVAGSTAAKDSRPEQTRAQQVRELVVKQREKVLAQIEAIFSGQQDRSQHAESAPADESATADEAVEPEGEGAEPEGAEIEEAEEAEGGEGEEEEVSELPDTGTGPSRGAETPSATLMAALGGLAAAGLGVRRRFSQNPG